MEQLVNFIIRPPRADYNPKHDLLEQEFMLRGKWYQRKDLEVKNGKGEVLQCSHYVPIVSPGSKPLPCVIYCHGNSGCRADASEAAIILLPSNITVFALDFSGSGLSGGEHVTLGWNEKDDLKAVVDYLRQDANVSMIGLWGRSMGSVTSLMYGAADPSIAGMVLDSPFSDLVDLMMELVDTYKIRLPKFTVKFAIQYMRKAIQKKAKFDITELNTIKVAKSCFVPALFGHAVEDDFIQPHHSDRIYEAYMGDKNIIKFEGDHNSPRPQFYFDSINIFFNNVLQPPEDEAGTAYFNMGRSYLGKDDWSTLHQMGYDLENPSASKEPTTSSTANAIKQVRMRRPMSKMEVPSDIADKPSEAEDETIDENDVPSSSGMINFEFSNGHPYGPQVPTAMDDDQYVEYQLEDLAGFPCNIEEEERMLMEAVMLSLKDMDLQQPLTEEETSTAKHAAPVSSLTSSEGEVLRANPASMESTSSDHPLKPLTLSNPVEVAEPSNTVIPSSMTDNQTSVTIRQAPSATLSFDPSVSKLESESSSTSAALSDTSVSIPNSTDSDLSSSTKATLTVERNPANHIMDGLIRRWDFFRNNR